MAVPVQTLRLLRRLANQVGATTDDTVRAITGQWLASWDRLEPAWRDAINAMVAQYAATGVWPALWQMARIEAVARAQQRTDQTLLRLVTAAASQAQTVARTVDAVTAEAQPRIIASQDRRIRLGDLLTPQAASAVLSERVARIGGLHSTLATDTASRAKDLLRRPPTGAEPGAALLADVRGLFETPLTRAVTVVRTETIDTYRTTARLIDKANRAVVSGWCWLCQCDRRSCIACWAMHGSTHPLDEPGPLGHPGCRCQRLPVVGDTSLPTAERRFRRLTRKQQLAILGRGRCDLFHNDQLAWADLAVRRSNPGWRDSYVPRPVHDLKRRAAV